MTKNVKMPVWVLLIVLVCLFAFGIFIGLLDASARTNNLRIDGDLVEAYDACVGLCKSKVK